MSEYFTDGVTASMPAVHDPGDLRERVDHLLAGEGRAIAPAGLAHVHANHSDARMWEQLAHAIADRGIVGPR
jgi:hypothetical protein